MIRDPLILALDQGTTSSRAIVYDRSGHVRAVGRAPLPLARPRPGWVECDAEAIWESQRRAAIEALGQLGGDRDRVVAVGLANQRETTILWDRRSGRALAPAVIWQCRRSEAVTAEWRRRGLEPAVRERTGLTLDPYFSASKIAWLFSADPGLRTQAEAGEVAFGTVDSFLIHRLSGGRRHVTDPTNASRTALYNPVTAKWDETLLSAFEIPPAVLPEVVPTVGPIATTEAGWFGRPLPLTAVAGDQQAALFGQGGYRTGTAKCTVGTGAFVLVGTGPTLPPLRSGLLRTVAWDLGEGLEYALEGSLLSAGETIHWLEETVGLIASAAETEALARSVADAGGVCWVPAFSGLGSPEWDPRARGLIIGLTGATTRAHLVRAALEGIACQIDDVLQAMVAATGRGLSSLRLDGGVSRNRFFAQHLADVSGLEVVRPREVEATARGAFLLAGIGAGLYQSVEALPEIEPDGTDRFLPTVGEEQRSRLRATWRRAVERARGWAEDAR